MKQLIAIILLVLCTFVLVWRGMESSATPIVKLVPARTNGIYKVTAYCPCEICCGKWADGITASGEKATGKLIAAPKDISFGTWLNVPGYGWAEVLDRGGRIKGKRLDVFFPTHTAAQNWGVRWLEIEQWLKRKDVDMTQKRDFGICQTK